MTIKTPLTTGESTEVEMAYESFTPGQKVLIEGMGDWVELALVHWHVQQSDPTAPLSAIQRNTLALIRSLTDDGLFELGSYPPSASGFVRASDTEGALSQIADAYVNHFADGEWERKWLLSITPKGEQMAQPFMETYRREWDAQSGE
ncbi:hypothetical protein [Mycobacteroides abscessus]|uniref:hypothetical protein n=1 Tax=Mycobacteroides abscessus TaxID=36809 RepID=UPI000C25CD3B|nr:hypothetical protein [Mycobacteroides abscessus]